MLAIAMAVAWAVYFARKPVQQTDTSKKQALTSQSVEKMTGAVLAVMITVMLAILMQGALKDGVSNWTPTVISRTLPVDTSTAILCGVLLPIFRPLAS